MARRMGNTWMMVGACILLGQLAGCATGPEGQTAKKIKITKLDDLPQHTYPVSGRISDMIQSDDRMIALAGKVRADIEKDLATYDIDDTATVQGMHDKLLNIDLIEGKYEDALVRIETIRGLESKEAGKLTAGLSTKALIAAKRKADFAKDPAKYKQAYASHLAVEVDKLPWDVVQDDIQQSKGRMEIFTENFILGIIESRIEPVVAETGELNADQASGLLGMYYTLNERMPLKDQTIAVYQKAIDANRVEKQDIWAERSVRLEASQGLTPVLMAAWDSGTDPGVFKERLFVNPYEKLDGQDTDGNGYIDDVNGIAFDYHANRTTGMLFPLGDAADRMPGIMKHMKGFTDLQAAIDSSEAGALKMHIGSLDPAAVKGFIEDIGLAGNYAHGTHVAGLMCAGNPAARLMIARLSYDYHMIPVARTPEWGERDGAKCRDTAEYFKKNGVRVVNMSWGESRKDAEDSLEANGIGESAEERREMARKVFAFQKEGLHEAVKNAPDVLFVCAAGNADNDVEFDDDIPSSFDLPNLMVVGAVDQAGDPTSFTSFGRTVQVYANGFEVESYVPGGQRMKMSGTSMASPNAANLAGKLLAVDPSLTPQQVIALIKNGADERSYGDKKFLLMNPRRSLKLLREQM